MGSVASIQFDLDDEQKLDLLFDLTAQIAKSERKRIGIGTVAKRLLVSLLDHPEAIQQLLNASDKPIARIVGARGLDDHEQEDNPRLKSATRRK